MISGRVLLLVAPSFKLVNMQQYIIFLIVVLTKTSAFISPKQCFTRNVRKSLQALESASLDSIDHALFGFQNTVTTSSVASNLQALLWQTIYTKPAMEHTQPFWGPPDPYLTAGTSIAPSGRSLADMGIEKSMEGLSDLAKTTAQSGITVIDRAAIKAESVLPGFTHTGSLLPGHDPGVPLESPATFAATVEWAAGFLNVVDKLPEAAFVYALVEFFILRPGIDTYKEDVEEDPTRAFADTLAVTSIRLGMFCIVSVVTTAMFG